VAPLTLASVCGISGSVRGGGASDRVVAQQLELLRHRGPDASGSYGNGIGVVAQSRLAVIDLKTGDPPITNEDGTIGAALNGEIYNFARLRADLAARGHRLRTSGDTEVLVHLAEEHSAAGIAAALDGMFAFAIWDSGRETLLLGRDRFGKKPLYYWYSPSTFVFGSEIKAVLAHPAVPRDFDEDALPAYLSFGYVPTPRTFFRGVLSLPPGHVLTIKPGREPELERYWSLPREDREAAQATTLRAAADEVRTRLESAVRKRLISDVPIGAFLSGGIDSSMIVALMAGMTDRPVQTFTIGFEDRDGYDERHHARIIAERYGTDHHEFVVAPQAVDLLEQLVWYHDQPFGDSSAIPTFLLNKLTRQHVTVALSGDGGDEAFAGYERFAAGVAAHRYRQLPRALRVGVQRALEPLPRGALRRRVGSAQRFARAADLGLPGAYLTWLSYFTETSRKEAIPDGSDWAIADFNRRWEATAGQPPLDRLLALNLATYLVDDLLVKADRMSMAHGLEVRSPFLDTDLVSYALTLPPGLQRHGFSRKRVLKAAAEDLLPSQIINRRKLGFGVPLDRWFRQDLASYVEGTLGSPQARVRMHLVPAVVDRLLAEHHSGVCDHGQALWLLLTLEVFLRREGW